MSGHSQQLTHTTVFQEIHHIWNPAFTAPGTELQFATFYRQQWAGFEGAPNTAVISAAYPFVDQNMSVGGALISDWTGNINKTGIQLNYAYKLKEIFSRDDQFVLALNGYFHQYRFDASQATTFVVDDPLRGNSVQSQFLPSFGAGFAYFTGTEEYSNENIFYFGFSTLQLLSTDVLLESGNAERQVHYFANIGTKLFGYDYYIEPSFQLNYVDPLLIDYVIGAKFEKEEAFWGGVSFSSLNDFAINGGIILDDIGGRYTQLKLGVLASLNGGAISNTGASFEFFAAYTLDLD